MPTSSEHARKTAQRPEPDNTVVIRQVSNDAEFDALQSDWLRLGAYAETPSVFRGWHWNRLWWKHYGHLGELYILVVSVAGTVECIAPFYKSSVRFLAIQQVPTLKFIGTGGDTSPDDVDVLLNPEFAEQTLNAVCVDLHAQSDIRLFQLTDMPKNSAFLYKFMTLSEERSLPKAQMRRQKRRVMQLPDSMDAYLASLSRNTRKRTKHRLRKLETAKNIEFQLSTTPEHVEEALNDLIQLHRMRRGEKNNSDSFQSTSYNQFHLALMQALLPLGELRLMRMRCDQKTVGVEYGFQTGGVLCFFQTGFDPEYDGLSPGHIMMLRLIEEAIGAGASEIDLLKGNYEYKDSYAKQWRTTINVELWLNPVHANIKSMMTSLRQSSVTPPWRTCLSENDSW